MKTIIMCIMTLCLFSLCIGQPTFSPLKESMALEVGTTHTFEFYENGEYVGYNQYTITKREVYNEKDAYFIESVVDITSDSLTLHMDASYIVTIQGVCLHYEFEATVDGESHTMKADFAEGSVHVTATRPGKEYDKTMEVAQNTFSLDNNMIDQWDIMFSAVTLESGGSIGIYTFAAQPMKTTMVAASISEVKVSVQAAGQTWQCFKLEFSAPDGYVMYVTEGGQLVKIESPSGLTITLKE